MFGNLIDIKKDGKASLNGEKPLPRGGRGCWLEIAMDSAMQLSLPDARC